MPCLLLFLLPACSPEHYKDDADAEVYQLIDQAWQPQFGDKSNYKVSDAATRPAGSELAPPIPQGGVLTLPQAVALATARNPLYQTERDLLYLTALNTTLIRHQYAPWIWGFLTSQFVHEDSPATEARNGVESGGQVLYQQFLTTGATITADFTNTWLSLFSGDGPEGLGSLLAVTVSQPLLRGAGAAVAREPLTQAERDVLFQVRAFNRYRQVFLVDVISQYYEVLEKHQVWQDALDNHRALGEQHARLGKLAAGGRVAPFEVQQARQDQLNAWDTAVRAENEYHLLLGLFVQYLALPTDRDFRLDERELAGLRALGLPDPDLTQSAAIAAALTFRLDLANRVQAIADAQRKIGVTENQLGPGLNLVASSNTFHTQRTTDVGGLRLANQHRVGLQIDLPIDRLLERNNYRLALLTLKQREREYEETKNLAIVEVRQAYRDLHEAAERHRVQLANLDLAAKRVKDTTLLIQFARATPRDVLDAQRDLYRAKVEGTSALVAYSKALLRLYRDTGLLQVRPDGLWQRRAMPAPATAPAAP